MKNIFHKRHRYRVWICFAIITLLLAALVCVFFYRKNMEPVSNLKKQVLAHKVEAMVYTGTENAIRKCYPSGCRYIDGYFYYFMNGKIQIRKHKINDKKPVVALTFDDGPGKYTKTLLNKLKKYGVRATFFMNGTNALKYQKEIQIMQEIGCELGNHTQTHANLIKLDEEQIREEIEGTNQAIRQAVGTNATLVRPPYGNVNDTVKEVAGYPLILWSLDTTDWKRRDAKAISDYIMKYAKDGDIILLHDIHKFSVDAVSEFIPKMKKKGYQFLTVSELAAYRNAQLEAGKLYFQFAK